MQKEQVSFKNIPILFAIGRSFFEEYDHFRYDLHGNEIISHITSFSFGSSGTEWNSDVRDYVEFNRIYNKSHIVSTEDLTVDFYETPQY